MDRALRLIWISGVATVAITLGIGLTSLLRGFLDWGLGISRSSHLDLRHSGRASHSLDTAQNGSATMGILGSWIYVRSRSNPHIGGIA